jgi:hypothetical protein
MRPLSTLLCLVLSLALPALAAVSPEHEKAIRATALDYVEGWFQGDAERMARALHPELAKRNVRMDPETGKSTLRKLSKEELVEYTARGGGNKTPKDQWDISVEVLDVYENMATVKVDSAHFMDYMHLAKWDGHWVIVNVLWAMHPKE